MQYLNKITESNWKLSRLTKHLLLVLGCLIVWFTPVLHNVWRGLDLQIYALFNQSLQYSRHWQLFWGYLNHPNESWLNVVVMALINVVGILTIAKDKRPRAIAMVIYFWLFFQLVLLFTQLLFADLLNIQRDSPSFFVHPWVVLSEALGIAKIKVFSGTSFPAGHVLVLIFWAKFTCLYANPQIKKIVIFTAVLLTFPRLFSGAHWASDIAFTIFYSLLWFEIAVGTPLYNYTINAIEKKIKPRILYEAHLH